MRPPPPPRLGVLQLRGQEWGWEAPAPSSARSVHRTSPGSAGRTKAGALGLLGSHPDPTSSLPGTRLPSPAPNLFLLPAPRLPPPPPPPQVPPGSRAAASLSPSRPRRRWSAGPLPGSLLPSLHLAPEAATATGDVRRTPPPARDTAHLHDRARSAR